MIEMKLLVLVCLLLISKIYGNDLCLPTRCPENCVNSQVIYRQVEMMEFDGVKCTICECKQNCPSVNCNLPYCSGEKMQVPDELNPGCVKCICACSLLPPICPKNCANNRPKQKITLGKDGCQICTCRKSNSRCSQNVCQLCKTIKAKRCKMCNCDADIDKDDYDENSDDDDDDDEDVDFEDTYKKHKKHKHKKGKRDKSKKQKKPKKKHEREKRKKKDKKKKKRKHDHPGKHGRSGKHRRPGKPGDFGKLGSVGNIHDRFEP